MNLIGEYLIERSVIAGEHIADDDEHAERRVEDHLQRAHLHADQLRIPHPRAEVGGRPRRRVLHDCVGDNSLAFNVEAIAAVAVTSPCVFKSVANSRWHSAHDWHAACRLRPLGHRFTTGQIGHFCKLRRNKVFCSCKHSALNYRNSAYHNILSLCTRAYVHSDIIYLLSYLNSLCFREATAVEIGATDGAAARINVNSSVV